MVYKGSSKDLLKEGLIKKSPVDYRVVVNLIDRAYADLETSKRNLDDDAECALNYAYNAILRSGLPLMFSEGFRPEIKDKHLTIVRFVSSLLGDEYNRLINNYDVLRRKRNRLIYEPDIPCSKKEAEEAIKVAKELLKLMHNLIKKQNPQLEFSFKTES